MVDQLVEDRMGDTSFMHEEDARNCGFAWRVPFFLFVVSPSQWSHNSSSSEKRSNLSYFSFLGMSLHVHSTIIVSKVRCGDLPDDVASSRARVFAARKREKGVKCVLRHGSSRGGIL